MKLANCHLNMNWKGGNLESNSVILNRYEEKNYIIFFYIWKLYHQLLTKASGIVVMVQDASGVIHCTLPPGWSIRCSTKVTRPLWVFAGEGSGWEGIFVMYWWMLNLLNVITDKMLLMILYRTIEWQWY